MAQRAPAVIIPKRSLTWISSIREEEIGTVPYVANSAQVIPSQGGILPSDKFYYGLRIKVRGRVTNGATGPAAPYADWPWSLVNRIHIEGYHRPRAAQEPFLDIRGPDCREFFGITQGNFPSLWTSVNGALMAPVLPRTANNGFSLANAATTDFIMFYDIIFPPAWPVPSPAINRQQAQWLLDAPNYDRLVMTIFWGDIAQGYVAANVPALGGFMVGAQAVPDCTVQALYALGGKNNLFQGFVPGRVWRYFAENTTGDIVAAATVNSRQYNLPRGFRIARLMTKTGVKSAVVTPGNDAYVTRLNTVFTARLILNYGTNKIIRMHPDYYALQETNRQNFEILPSDGYGIFDFISHGHLQEALDCQSLIAGPTGDVDVFLSSNIAGAANTAALFLVEELRGQPQFVS